MTLQKLTLVACAAVIGISFTAPAMADADGEIKYRKSVMKSVGGQIGAIITILKGQTGNAANLAIHTQGLVNLSKISGSIFPEGSDFGETEALPAIWEKPGQFSKAVKMFQDAADKMNAAAMSGDMAAAGAAFGGVGKSCKNCHENFREKKQ